MRATTSVCLTTCILLPRYSTTCVGVMAGDECNGRHITLNAYTTPGAVDLLVDRVIDAMQYMRDGTIGVLSCRAATGTGEREAGSGNGHREQRPDAHSPARFPMRRRQPPAPAGSGSSTT